MLVMMVILTMIIAMVIFGIVNLVCGIVCTWYLVKLVPSVFPLENYTLGWKKSASAVVRMVTNMSIILIITIITTLMPCMQRLLFMGVQAVWPDSQVYLYSSKSWCHMFIWYDIVAQSQSSVCSQQCETSSIIRSTSLHLYDSIASVNISAISTSMCQNHQHAMLWPKTFTHRISLEHPHLQSEVRKWF